MRYKAENTKLKAEVDRLNAELDALTETKNGAYHERNQIVAALAKIFPSSIERHVGEDWGPDWLWVCIIDLPTGQVSWHIETSEIGLFDQIPHGSSRVWDGHDTDEKYRRLRALAADYRISIPALSGRIKIQWDRIHTLEDELTTIREADDVYIALLSEVIKSLGPCLPYTKLIAANNKWLASRNGPAEAVR
jgi:hypothetical protein